MIFRGEWNKMNLLNYNFEYIQDLIPEFDTNGKIKEFSPQDSYERKHEVQLNKYGEGTFCRFHIHKKWSGVSGVYAFFVDDKLVYIGQTKDFAQRFNAGYGNISPRNCFEGGQSTNCKINKMVLASVKSGKVVSIYFHTTSNCNEVESILIKYFNPQFNIALTNNSVVFQNKKVTQEKPDNSANSIKSVKATKNPSISEVRKYIQRQLINAKEQGASELILRSGEIHCNLNMRNAMPTVCSAMRTLDGSYKYEVLEEPPKGNGSRLIFRYMLN